MDKWKAVKIFIAINIIVLNVLVGYLVYVNLISSQSEPKKESLNTVSTQNPQQVDKDALVTQLKDYIDQRVKLSSANSVSPTPTSTPQPVATKAPLPSKTKQYYYMPIPGSGETLSNDWVDISGTDFYFDPAEYTGLIEARFESNMRLVNGNGKAWVRIYDVTHSITVINSEIQTSSQTTDNVTSDILLFWAGRNLYRIQAKSLTADTAVYEGGRIKVVTEN